VIFVDSNFPIYLVGAEHPNKAAARSLLERAITDGKLLVTDAGVLQEILHRYVAIDRRDAIEPATAALLAWSTRCSRSSGPTSSGPARSSSARGCRLATRSTSRSCVAAASRGS